MNVEHTHTQTETKNLIETNTPFTNTCIKTFNKKISFLTN